jgi:hypothetical protein
MMRLIEKQMVDALKKGDNWSKDNTMVRWHSFLTGNEDYADVTLHGHRIASYFPKSGVLHLRDAGFRTATTKSRLNVLLREFGQGDRLYIYQQCRGHKTKKHHECDWFYVMGASTYVWNGEHNFTTK